MLIGHNPLIFASSPKEQYELLSSSSNGNATTLMSSLSGGGDISKCVNELDVLYDEARKTLIEAGIYYTAIECFGTMPVALKFNMAVGESGLDQPRQSKLYGIPDLRGDFLFEHPRAMRDVTENWDDLPEWSKLSLEETILRLWPRDPVDGYMKFAAQVMMPNHYWYLFSLSSCRRTVPNPYFDDEDEVSISIIDMPVFQKSHAYAFHNIHASWDSKLSAYVVFSKPGKLDDVLPWDEYVAAVQKVIPPECYMQDGHMISSPLGDPIIGLGFDFGQQYYHDSTSGAFKFWKEVEKIEGIDGGNIAFDLEFDSQGGVVLGGKPNSQQEERRPWDHRAFGSPTRMTPFLSYHEGKHDVTHQIYTSRFSADEDSAWGIDDASCT